MSKITKAFKNKKAFIPFIVGGDPTLDITEKLLYAMEDVGADLIEVGIPFSDPIAEGPIIQEANERALAGGCTTDRLFDTIKKARKRVTVPIVYLTYANVVFKYGSERFMKKCAECGIEGLIIQDVPYEEKEEFAQVCKDYGIQWITLISTPSKERIKVLSKNAQGFVCCIPSQKGLKTEEVVKLIRETSDIPVVVECDASTPEQAYNAAAKADGIIVGNSIVKLVAKYGSGSPRFVAEYVKSMKEAIM